MIRLVCIILFICPLSLSLFHRAKCVSHRFVRSASCTLVLHAASCKTSTLIHHPLSFRLSRSFTLVSYPSTPSAFNRRSPLFSLLETLCEEFEKNGRVKDGFGEFGILASINL